MKNIDFRLLNAEDIEIRPTDTKTKGSCTLLLYQNARTAMDILDECFGPFGWQKKYEEVKGNVYCSIGIKDPDTGEWVWKSDCGMESNVDAAKGEASDATKRAAVCWGIGRELYSGPRVKIKCPDNYYYDNRMTMTFYVRNIEYENRKIKHLTIADKLNNIVYDWDANAPSTTYQPSPVSVPTGNTQTYDHLAEWKEYCSKKVKTNQASKEDTRAIYERGKQEASNNKYKDFFASSLWKRLARDIAPSLAS